MATFVGGLLKHIQTKTYLPPVMLNTARTATHKMKHGQTRNGHKHVRHGDTRKELGKPNTDKPNHKYVANQANTAQRSPTIHHLHERMNVNELRECNCSWETINPRYPLHSHISCAEESQFNSATQNMLSSHMR